MIASWMTAASMIISSNNAMTMVVPRLIGFLSA
jgi:hypothetical protein